MAFVRQEPPGWFRWAAAILTLWGAIGCFACWRQFRYGADAMGPATAYQRTLYAALPCWYNYVYAVAVGAALIGGLLLLRRSAAARGVFMVSLAAVVIQFGWLFVSTDILKVQGPSTAIFPLIVAAVALVSIRFAVTARRRGWIC